MSRPGRLRSVSNLYPRALMFYSQMCSEMKLHISHARRGGAVVLNSAPFLALTPDSPFRGRSFALVRGGPTRLGRGGEEGLDLPLDDPCRPAVDFDPTIHLDVVFHLNDMKE